MRIIKFLGGMHPTIFWVSAAVWYFFIGLGSGEVSYDLPLAFTMCIVAIVFSLASWLACASLFDFDTVHYRIRRQKDIAIPIVAGLLWPLVMLLVIFGLFWRLIMFINSLD